MKMLKISIPVVIVIAILALIFLVPGRSASGPSYENTDVGYRISLQPGWHVSEGLSRKIDDYFYMSALYGSLGCGPADVAATTGTSTDVSVAMLSCAEKKPGFDSLKAKHDAYSASWKLGSSQLVLITDMAPEEEAPITVEQLSDPQEKLPIGKYVAIRPFNTLFSFTMPSTGSNGLVRDFFRLADGTNAYLDDWRGAKMPQQGLVLSVPVRTKAVLYSGEAIQSVVVLSSAAKGSKEEQAFFAMAKTIKTDK